MGRPGPASSRAVAAVLALCVVFAGCSAIPVGPTSTTDPGTGSFDSPAYAADTYRVTVVEVVDGDTVDVRYRNGTRDTVRLLGVDTPETSGEVTPDEFEGVPDTRAGRECLRAEARDASEFLTERLAGESVVLVLDERADRRGYYDRLLAMVFLEGENVNERLVGAGYARVYTSGFSVQKRFLAQEADAQRANTGVWRCQFDGSTTTTSERQLVEMHADASGNDHENLDGEYVVFENAGRDPLNVGGWTVSDETVLTSEYE